mmetsp:Transcript_21090/g.37348  ORF Transcript_21090/g.37348 Transcript_21090/m.37348 type:complete len:482 (+) Transcript_21090:27-1472(+)
MAPLRRMGMRQLALAAEHGAGRGWKKLRGIEMRGIAGLAAGRGRENGQDGGGACRPHDAPQLRQLPARQDLGVAGVLSGRKTQGNGVARFLCREFSSKQSNAVLGMSSIKDTATQVAKLLEQIEVQLNARGVIEREKELAKILEAPDLWDNPARANKLSQEHGSLRGLVTGLEELKQKHDNALELAMMAFEEDEKDPENVTVAQDCMEDLETALKKAESLQIELLLDGTADARGCFLEFTAGAGGTESCDFTEMLLNMFTKWAVATGYQAKVAELTPNSDGGVRSATLEVQGHNAYGWMKSESGVHRMVRISEHDAQGKRHTCFARVVVLPVVEDENDDAIAINPADLRVDVFRASGAGGQHVNTTESAVRITHIPTGIQAQSQQERSQHQNRALAMKVLQSRILQAKLDQEASERREFESTLGDNAWGNQIRSYVLHPYKLVKDHRTNHESANAFAVLAGDPDYLTPFMEAMLFKNSSSK